MSVRALALSQQTKAIWMGNPEDGPIKDFFDALRIEPCYLTTLTLNRSLLCADNIKMLSIALKTNRSLTQLYLGVTNIDADGAKVLAKALKTNNTLSTLGLYWNELGDQGAIELAEALHVNRSLTTLNLGHNKLGDQGIIALAEALKTNCSLTTLDLSYNQIADGGHATDIGTSSLATALKINNCLLTLDLMGWRFTIDLLNALKVNPYLQRIATDDRSDLPRERYDYEARNKELLQQKTSLCWWLCISQGDLFVDPKTWESIARMAIKSSVLTLL